MPSVTEDEYIQKLITDPARGMAWDHNVGTYKIQSQHDHNVHIIRKIPIVIHTHAQSSNIIVRGRYDDRAGGEGLYIL